MNAPNFYSAVNLFLMKDGLILLQRRSNTGFMDGMYGVPAGHVEGKETIVGALIREAKEEIGITLQEKDLKVAHIMHRVSADDRVYFDIILTAETWSGEIQNLEPEKHDEVRWFPLNQLPENFIPYFKRSLERMDKGIFFSEEQS